MAWVDSGDNLILREVERIVGLPVQEAAQLILGHRIEVGELGFTITEVEAYAGDDDPASHAWRGETKRNRSMFLRGGTLYVYFTYGMHWCSNVVTGPPGVASAILIRSVVCDSSDMGTVGRTDGPARFCREAGISGQDDGTDLLAPGSRIRLADGSPPGAGKIMRGRRIGISRGREFEWRYWIQA